MGKQPINTYKNNALLIRGIAAIFWLGFFMAISFMEAPLKFSAPGVTLAQGLQIGRIVFGVLNHLEWVFFIVILATCLIYKPGHFETLLIVCLDVILILETFWLLPALDTKATAIIGGKIVADHGLHWCYIILELIKAPVLSLIGIKSLRKLASH
jgi:hypothetical protein